MNVWEAFSILEIDVTNDKKAIKKAYAKLVKQYHPEEHPKEWQILHDAYETALKGASVAGTMQMPFDGHQESGGKTGITEVSLTASGGIDEKKYWEEKSQKEKSQDEEPRKEEPRKEEPQDEESREEKHQENKALSEEQEIEQMFEHIEELVQKKQEDAVDEEIQKLKKLSGMTPRERVNTAKKYKEQMDIIAGIVSFFILIFIGIAIIYKQEGTSREEEVKEKRISSYADLQANMKEETERWYRGLYLPTLAGSGDEELQKATLDRGIYLQEGIYLTLQQDDMQAGTDAYTICEAEAPKQLEKLAGEKIGDCQVRAFCINSDDKPVCAVLWCDTEKLGFGDAVRIFYYDGEKQDYVEVIQSGEDSARMESAGEELTQNDTVLKHSYGMLGYRAFIIDTHVHGRGEMCPYPVVVIEKIKND